MKNIKVYSFDELSDQAKEKAIQQYNESQSDFHWQNEWEYTLNEFCSIFPIKWESWDIYEGIYSKFNIDNDINELKGIRLMKYIINNFDGILFKDKFIGTIKSKVYHPRIKSEKLSNGKYFNPYYSKIFFDKHCNLTGFCGDNDILRPIYHFLKNPNNNVSLSEILQECLESWLIGVRNDYEYQQTEEYLSDFFNANEYEFLENGQQI